LCGDPGDPDDPQPLGMSEGVVIEEPVEDGLVGGELDYGGGGGQQYCLRTRTVTKRYYVSGGKVLMEKDMETGQVTKYIYAGDERIAMIDYQGRTYYYVKDHLGSTRVLVRDDGVSSAKYYRYTAYGDCKKETMNISQPNKYTGKPLDGELGLNLYYFGARYYMANLGRWASVDPLLGKYPGWSPYAYTRCNPLTLIDPDGMADQLAPQSAEQNNENFRERNGAPPNKIAVVKEMDKKVREIIQRLAEVTTEAAEKGLDAVEDVANTAGPTITVAGTLSGQPEVTAAGVAISGVGVAATTLKAFVNPTSENRNDALVSVGTFALSRYGSNFIKQQVTAQRLTQAEATALSIETAIGVKAAKEAMSIIIEKQCDRFSIEPQR